MKSAKILSRGGMVYGPSHENGGVKFMVDGTTPIEEEGFEFNIPKELTKSKKVYTFHGKNRQIINDILKISGLSAIDKVTTVRSGDIIICVNSAWDNKERTYTGTITQILSAINTSSGCKHIESGAVVKKSGGRVSIKKKILDDEILNPNSDRWKKKKGRIEEISNNVHKLRINVSRDIKSDDEKEFLTALVIALMDKTAERVGNDDSADKGHFGITGLQKKHVKVIGNKVHLDYKGKSGVQHEKSFSDERIAKALKRAVKNSPNHYLFSTSDGFRVRADKVNRYLEDFKITAKDIRGYSANKWIIEKLQATDIPDKEKERKQKFNSIVKTIAQRIGHGSGTLKKHYMIPELPTEYIVNGRIIDMKNLGYFKAGGEIETNPIKNTNTMQEETKPSQPINEVGGPEDAGIQEGLKGNDGPPPRISIKDALIKEKKIYYTLTSPLPIHEEGTNIVLEQSHQITNKYGNYWLWDVYMEAPNGKKYWKQYDYSYEKAMKRADDLKETILAGYVIQEKLKQA